MTIKEAEERLRTVGVPDPRDEARRIFSLIGGTPHHRLLSPLFETSDARVIRAIEKRCERIPLAYIIGEVDFYRERYRITPDCLIPRPDTEILVERAISLLPEGARFLDLCTGSGCVALSVLRNTKNTRAVAVDISGGALATAKENAVRLGLSDRIEFINCDVLKEEIEGDFFAVLSNPPYVSESAYASLEEEIYREPKIAFLGGEDGADFYRALTPLYREICERGGFIAYEIGYDQGEVLKKIAKENSLHCEITPDLSGNDRVAILSALKE